MKSNPPRRHFSSSNQGRQSRSFGNREHVLESSGPTGKVRGTPQQIIDKYMNLGRDALSAGDYVASESYFQFAEHYRRVLIVKKGEEASSPQEKAPPPQEKPPPPQEKPAAPPLEERETQTPKTPAPAEEKDDGSLPAFLATPAPTGLKREKKISDPAATPPKRRVVRRSRKTAVSQPAPEERKDESRTNEGPPS